MRIRHNLILPATSVILLALLLTGVHSCGQQEIEKKERIIVGVNQFTVDKESTPEILRVDPTIRKRQSDKLQKLKTERNNSQVKQFLEKLREAANNDKINLMPFILEAVKAYATLGEICDVLREEFGEYHELIVL